MLFKRAESRVEWYTLLKMVKLIHMTKLQKEWI